LRPVPSPGTPPPKPRLIVYIVGGIAWLLFLALALYSPWFFWVWGAREMFSPSDALYAVRFPLWLLTFFGISQSSLGHTRSAARTWRKILYFGVVTAGVALAVVLLRTGDLLIASPKWNPAQAKSLTTLNQMIASVLVLGCIVSRLAVLRAFI